MKKFLLGLMLICTPAFGAIVSPDHTFTSADIHSSTFAAKLNRITTQIVQGVNSVESSQIKNATIKAEDMADESNPIKRTNESASCPDVIFSGLLPATSASLTSDISAGTAYPDGVRINKASATAHSYTASKWTWVYLDTNGDFQYQEAAIGGATPATPANSAILARVSSDTATVNSVTDLRVTSCTSGPFSIISDSTGEATLGDILGNPKWSNGLNITSQDATTINVAAGVANINGEYRALTSPKNVPTTAGNSVTGVSGLDAGSLAANTTYYVYGTADVDGTKAPTVLLSTSASAPSGATNSRRLGEITTEHAVASFASSDAVSVSYLGKIRQIKRFQTGSYVTGSTSMPADGTIPTSSEGDQYMALSFTPVSATNILKIDVVFYGTQTSGNYLIAALYKDSMIGALAAAGTFATNSGAMMDHVVFTHYTQAGTTGSTTFKVRGGSGGTIHFNGANVTGAYFGGRVPSSITITEFEA
jgi:hypothetical protein